MPRKKLKDKLLKMLNFHCGKASVVRFAISPKYMFIQRAVVPIGEREHRMKRFFAFFLMEVAQGCVCEREKHLFVPDRMFPCPYDMLYNSLIPG